MGETHDCNWDGQASDMGSIGVVSVHFQLLYVE